MPPRNVARRGRPLKRPYPQDKSGEDVKPSLVHLEDNDSYPEAILFECAVCFFTTQEERSFLQHVQDVHKREMGYWCKWCGKSFVNPTALVDHVKGKCKREKLYLHPCGFPKCGFVHSDPSVFSFHLKNEHKGKYLMPCALCEQPFTIPSSLIFHLQEHCPQKAKCLLQGNNERNFLDLNNSKFSNSHRNKQRRVRRQSGDMDFDCDGSPQSVLECAACLFRTSDPEEFTEHHNDMHKREVCCCKHCGQAFKNANLLLSHHQGHTCPKEKRFEHPCGVNGCSFLDSDPLIFVSHLKSCHTQEPLYPCYGCQKQFTIFPLLVNHMQQECSSLNKNTASKRAQLASRPIERPAHKVIRTYDNQATEGEVEVSDVEDLNECVDDGGNAGTVVRPQGDATPASNNPPGSSTEVMEIEITPNYLGYDSDGEDLEDLPMIVPTAIPRRGRGVRGAGGPRARRSRGRRIKQEY